MTKVTHLIGIRIADRSDQQLSNDNQEHTMTTTNPRRRRARLGLAALGATIAGLTMTGGVAGAAGQVTPSPTPNRALLTNVQLDDDVVHIDSVRRTPMLPSGVLKTDVCVRSLNGTFQILPARLCP